uniref:hypothetical protein n=1 Tax=uncultured Deinococcus sp. TaxID=158789 RepID=UPI00258E71B3
LLDPEPLTPAMLGVADEAALTARLGQYLVIAGVEASGTPTEPQRQRVLALIYGARIVVLEGQVEKFRAEGEITLERDLQSRITRLATARDAALLLAQPVVVGESNTFAPLMEPWGVAGEC